MELRDKERDKAIEGVLFIGDVVVAEDFLEAVDDAVFGLKSTRSFLRRGGTIGWYAVDLSPKRMFPSTCWLYVSVQT